MRGNVHAPSDIGEIHRNRKRDQLHQAGLQEYGERLGGRIGEVRGVVRALLPLRQERPLQMQTRRASFEQESGLEGTLPGARTRTTWERRRERSPRG